MSAEKVLDLREGVYRALVFLRSDGAACVFYTGPGSFHASQEPIELTPGWRGTVARELLKRIGAV